MLEQKNARFGAPPALVKFFIKPCLGDRTRRPRWLDQLPLSTQEDGVPGVVRDEIVLRHSQAIARGFRNPANRDARNARRVAQRLHHHDPH